MTGGLTSSQFFRRRLLGRRTGRYGVALLLAVASFGLYGFTSGHLVGYEPETAAVAEGLVKQGALRVLPGTPLTTEGTVARGGQRFSRTGLAQPLLEAPFYFVGTILMILSSSFAGEPRPSRLDVEK